MHGRRWPEGEIKKIFLENSTLMASNQGGKFLNFPTINSYFEHSNN